MCTPHKGKPALQVPEYRLITRDFPNNHVFGFFQSVCRTSIVPKFKTNVSPVHPRSRFPVSRSRFLSFLSNFGDRLGQDSHNLLELSVRALISCQARLQVPLK